MKFNCKNFAKTLYYSKNDDKLIKTFKYAKQENRKQALQILMWARDVNGGNIKKSIMLLEYIAKNTDDIIDDTFLSSVTTYGSFKDLNRMYIVANPKNKSIILNFYSNQLKSRNQMAAKWTPRKGKLFYALANNLYMKIGDFRRYIANMYISVETKMCANMWECISLNEVPERALSKYNKVLSKKLNATIRFRTAKPRKLKFKNCEKLLSKY